MSKFLKFLVHTIIICTILCVLAIFVPPLFGVQTTVMDGTYKDTNLLLGSVTYSKEIEKNEVKPGDSLTVVNGTSAHRFEVISVDMAQSTCLVRDPSLSGDITQTLSIANTVWKALFSVEFIGYLLVAVQSKEGMMILGLAVLILIVLYIIAELWKKDPEEDQEGLPSDVVVKSAKELKEEEKEKERQRKAEDREYLARKKGEAAADKENVKLSRKEEKARKKAEKKRRKAMKTVTTGGFIDEIEEEDLVIEAGEEEQRPEEHVRMATSEAHEELKKEIAAATAEEPETVEELLQPEEPAETFTEEESSQAEEPVELKKMAVPRYTAEELAAQVKASGDVPQVMRDEISKVVLFDYSDIITSDQD